MAHAAPFRRRIGGDGLKQTVAGADTRCGFPCHEGNEGLHSEPWNDGRAARLGAVLLAIVGAIVAFNGWPTGGVGDDIRRLVVGDEETSSLSPGAVEAVDSASVTADAVVTDEPLGPDVDVVVADFVPPSSLGPRRPAGPLTAAPPVRVLRMSAAPAPALPRPAPRAAAAPELSPSTRLWKPPERSRPDPSNGTLLSTEPLTNGLSDTVNGTTDRLGGAVGGPLGQTVDQAGDNLTDLVRGLPDVKVGSNPK